MAVASAGRQGRCRALQGAPGRGTLAKDKPPIFGMIQRCGDVVIRMLENVRQATIEPLIRQTVQAGTLVYTDEYSIYARLQEWGYAHKSVNHGAGEYARDEDGDGFHEVHVNTMEGFWQGCPIKIINLLILLAIFSRIEMCRLEKVHKYQ